MGQASPRIGGFACLFFIKGKFGCLLSFFLEYSRKCNNNAIFYQIHGMAFVLK